MKTVNPSPNPTKSTETAETVSVEATTVALFRAKNAYREEIRSEITQTELDDRHDIDGNTIFRLTFDASIIAGTRRDSVAAIGVRLQHDPVAESPLHELFLADYRSLYQDWAEYFQRTLRKSLLSIPKSLLTPQPYPPMRLLFSQFLQRRICQFYLPNVDINKILNENPPECPKPDKIGAPDPRARADNLLRAFTERRSKVLEAKRSTEFGKRVAEFSSRQFRLLVKDSDALKELAINACRISPSGDRIPISNIFIYDPTGRQTQDEIGCPYFDSLKERLLSGVLLYQKLASMTSEERSKWIGTGKDDMGCSEDECDVKLSTLKCFTADFLKANLNAFQDPNAQEQQKIDHFLKLEIVGRSVDDCDILVSSRIKRYKEQGAQDTLLREFIGQLNSGTDAFAYSVTPKNLTENISTASDTRDAFTAMLRPNFEGKEIASLLKQRSEQNLAIVAHPIVVGFGSGFNTLDEKQEIKAVRSLDFGWVVAPRSLSERVYEQIDGQYPLTAFISVPAWWRTARVVINSCWLARRALAYTELDQPASKICEQHSSKHSSEIIVRLPPAVPEISRKLAFDVVQQPSLYNPTPKELVIGMPGALLLEGARLWRSTEVTAGSQHADRITVLPNMEGILAEFDCVRPPTGPRTLRQSFGEPLDNNQTVTYDSIQVWTSEGVTDQNPVTFIWPLKEKDKEFLRANALCPDTRPKATVAPSADAASKQPQIATLTRDGPSTVDQPPTNASTPPSSPVTSVVTAPPGVPGSNSASASDKAIPPVTDPSVVQSVRTPENPASTPSPNKSP